MKSQPTIIFMGTPMIAATSLRALHASGFNVALVVTQPDRPSGRGRHCTPPAVKITAMELNYPFRQPQKVRDPVFIEELRSFSPDFLVVVAFGQILSQPLLDLPKRGPINVHGSLLPKFRGPAPIQWAIIRGERETGVTTMLMDRGVDTGDILLMERTPIAPTDTFETLHDRLAEMGAHLLVRTLNKLWTDELFPRAQSHDDATYAPLLQKNDGRIDWTLPAGHIDCLVRALNPWPGAFCFWNEQRLKLFKVAVIASSTAAPPGTVVPGFPDELRIATGHGQLSILEIQGASGKRLNVKDFLHGHHLSPGMLLN
jgi:methionyl-tRNA formyltransferase